MTYDDWWEQFKDDHEEWRYADSNALRKAAYEAGAASRDAEVAQLRELLNCYNLGGWTDSARLIKERDQLRTELEAARAEIERLENQVQARDAELWGRTQKILQLEQQYLQGQRDF